MFNKPFYANGLLKLEKNKPFVAYFNGKKIKNYFDLLDTNFGFTIYFTDHTVRIRSC